MALGIIRRYQAALKRGADQKEALVEAEEETSGILRDSPAGGLFGRGAGGGVLQEEDSAARLAALNAKLGVGPLGVPLRESRDDWTRRHLAPGSGPELAERFSQSLQQQIAVPTGNGVLRDEMLPTRGHVFRGDGPERGVVLGAEDQRSDFLDALVEDRIDFRRRHGPEAGRRPATDSERIEFRRRLAIGTGA
jgi:hypothetical protein